LSVNSESTKTYWSDIPCKNGHKGERYKGNSGCVVCARLRAKTWAQNNRKAVAQNSKAYADKNRQEVNARIKDWKQRNQGKVRSQTASRRARCKAAQPTWVKSEELLAIYQQAQRVSDMIGITYHVDHIIPLQHPCVCGLHVPWNLQIIPAWQNLQKQNKY
jgi:hypothetical protein